MSKTVKTAQLKNNKPSTENLIKKTTDNARSQKTKTEPKTTTTLPTGKSKIETTKATTTTSKSSKLNTTKPTTTISIKPTTTAKTTTATARTLAKPAPVTLANANTTKLRTKTTTRSSNDRNQPLRVKHDLAKEKSNEKLKIPTNTASVAKPNAVLDTYHNVTVSSPPSKRKETKEATSVNDEEIGFIKRARTRTRTLNPDEVIVLKRESAKQRMEAQIQAEQKSAVKEPIAFEVNFTSTASEVQRERSKSRVRKEKTNTKNAADNDKQEEEEEQANYSDDFESYESDFESSSHASQQDTATESDESSELSDSSDKANTSADEDCLATKVDAKNDIDNKLNDDNTEEESEITQYPITVIQRDKEYERKLDSGNYDMNSRKQPKLTEIPPQSIQQQYDSFEMFSTATTTSEQLDSGISSYDSPPQTDLNKRNSVAFYGGYAQFNTKPISTVRGREILKKIKFDTISFVLFDLKPISYEVFMQSYGNLNTTQASSQTQEQCLSIDTQTEEIEMRTMWTQHPGQYDRQTLNNLKQQQHLDYTLQNCCGEIVASHNTKNTADLYDESIAQLHVFQQEENRRSTQRNLKQFNKSIDIERLNAFLQRATTLMASVLNESQIKKQQQINMQTTNNKLTSVSRNLLSLDTTFLNALHVVRVFANAHFNLIITVHECLDDANVYRSEFSQLLMVWSTTEWSKPIRLLSTWSQVCRAEICNASQDILICGLRDGSIAMWDLRETYSYCSKLDGHLTHFAATQTIVPHMPTRDASKQQAGFFDMGAVVDIRSFRVNSKANGVVGAVGSYEPMQFISLNDTGILTLWTLVEKTKTHYNTTTTTSTAAKVYKLIPSNKFEYSSPWARVQLIQTAITDLREYLQDSLLKAQTQFDKTKALFQNNIYNDELLREFATTPSNAEHVQQPLQGLRFTSIDVGCERVYICTNRNFIIGCSKTLKTERFRKISINESKLLFPTALCVLSNEDFIAVGLSNGSVVLLNCQQRKPYAQTQQQAMFKSKTHTAHTTDTVTELDTGKSCAIQNIILNERRSFDEESSSQNDVDLRPTTAACIDMITNRKRPFELSVHDQQLLLSGITLRQDLVQCLELSSDGWRLFALTNGKLRVYDFYMESELDWPADRNNIKCIAMARTSAEEQHLITLHLDDHVDVHILTH